MKKRLIGTLLMGALLVSSTSMFVSCKDYDDDINSLSTRTTALEAAKTELEQKISDLRAELETVYATKAELETATEAEKERAMAAEAALETKLRVAEEARQELETLIGGDLNDDSAGELKGLSYQEALLKTWAKVLSVDEEFQAFKKAFDINDPNSMISLYMQTIQNQIDALNAYTSDFKEGDKAATVAYAQSLLEQAKSYTEDEIKNLNIPELREKLTTLSNKVSEISDQLDVLVMVSRQLRGLVFRPTGYVDGVEAVKILTLDYWKFTLAATSWKTQEANYNEASLDITTVTDGSADRNDDHTRYAQTKNLARTLDFAAEYHLNPTSANLSEITKDDVKPLSDDKWFESTRAAAAGFYTKEIYKPGMEYGDGNKVESGILRVHYGLTNANKLAEGNQITVFATQVNYGDTVITSDYATVLNAKYDSLVLSHAPKSVAPSLRTIGTEPFRNTHCGGCDLDAARKNMHLFATITEAAGTGADKKTDNMFAPQDSVAYNSDGLDLTKLVEIHYTDKATHKHQLMTAKEMANYGLTYKFELTKLVYGQSATSESAHAVIVEKDGKPYLIPWMPTDENREGVQSAYDETKKEQYQTKQLVGRTPLVRVSLIGKDSQGNDEVIDYGYIRILITDVKEDDPIETPDNYRRFIEYVGDAKTYEVPWFYQTGCTSWPTTYSYNYVTNWIETELKLYTMAGVSKADFDANWTVVETTTAGLLQQYTVGAANEDGTKRIFTKATKDWGTVTETLATSGADGKDSETTTLEWKLTYSDIENFYKTTNRPEALQIAVCYIYDPDGDGISNNETKDIYVIFSTGKITFDVKPEIKGSISWDGRKITNKWYAKNSNVANSGLVEVHANVYAAQDDQATLAEHFALNFEDQFVGDKIVNLKDATDLAKFVKLENATGISMNDVALQLQFTTKDAKGNQLPNTFKGYYGGKLQTFVTEPSADGLDLNAVIQDGSKMSQTIAKLVDNNDYTSRPSDVNRVAVQLLHTDFAEALLNYKGRFDLDDDVLTAYVTVVASYKNCNKDVTKGGISLECEPLHVRYLRPINVEKTTDKYLTDASDEEGGQFVNLYDLVVFSDWRNGTFADHPDYWKYYNITSVEVIGTKITVDEEQDISDNTWTNMNLAPGSEPTNVLSDITSKVKLYVQYDTPYYTPSSGKPAAGDFGKIIYKNNGSTVQEFKVRIPVMVTYEWGGAWNWADNWTGTKYANIGNTQKGAFYTTVDITVKSTQGDARQK